MALRDAIRQGSFRGAIFQYDTATLDTGRRIAKHEFPLRDKPYPEDMGRSAREFSLDVFTAGPSYAADADQLRQACEKPGAGLLIHPLYGEMMVKVPSCRVIERSQELGKVYFSIGFIEDGDIGFSIRQAASPGAATQGAAASLLGSAADSFSGTFKTGGLSDFVGLSALGNLNGALTRVQNAISLQSLGGGAIGNWVRALTGLRGTAQGLFNTPATLSEQIQSLIGGLSFAGSLNTSWGDIFSGRQGADTDSIRRSQIAVSTIGLPSASGISDGFTGPIATGIAPPPSVAAATPDRIQEAANNGAMLALIRQTALGEAAQAAVATPYASSDQAIAVRDDLAARIDAEAMIATSDTVYRALADLRLSVLREITAASVDLPNLRSYTPVATVPALVLAFRLYGDPSWAGDIVARNDIRHPGFVPGGQALELLNA